MGQPRVRPRAWVARGVAELIVIVVGVLAALSLENWWAERQERSLEADYISALFGEAQSQIAGLSAIQSANDRKRASLFEAVRLLEAPFEPEMTADLFHGLLQGSGIPVVPEFPTAVFVDLQSSGRLRLISDDRLRRAAIAHYSLIPAMLQRAQSWAEATGSTLHSFISSRAPVGTVKQTGPALALDWTGITETEIQEIGAEIHSHADVRRLVNAQARQLEGERSILEELSTDLEDYARLFDGVAP